MRVRVGLPQKYIPNLIQYLRWSVLQNYFCKSPSHMFDKALSTTLLPKKGKVFPALVEAFLLKNSFKQSGNFNFLIFPCEAFGFIIQKRKHHQQDNLRLADLNICPTLKNILLGTCLVVKTYKKRGIEGIHLTFPPHILSVQVKSQNMLHHGSAGTSSE